jgi:hypothetical protein
LVPGGPGRVGVTLRGVTVASLASYRHGCDRLMDAWPGFLVKRDQRLAQQRRFGTAAEKVAENILEDLFTMVLDWQLSEVNNQVGHADLALTRLGVKHLIIEVKRPGALAWNQRSVDLALAQAHRYADEQKVQCIAVSDGVMLYARDRVPGGTGTASSSVSTRPRHRWSCGGSAPTGSTGPGEGPSGAMLRLLPPAPAGTRQPASPGQAELAHPKYRLPARCFAYVGNAADPATWHVPYLLADSTPDPARLPKAIQAILSNYRGAHVSSVPEAAIPDILVTLARTAHELGKLPATGPGCARTYTQLQEALDQLGRLTDALAPYRRPAWNSADRLDA